MTDEFERLWRRAMAGSLPQAHLEEVPSPGGAIERVWLGAALGLFRIGRVLVVVPGSYQLTRPAYGAFLATVAEEVAGRSGVAVMTAVALARLENEARFLLADCLFMPLA